MAELLFRQGELSQLFNTDGTVKDFIEGSLNFTTDEPAIYLDYNNQRLRIGDIREFDSIEKIKEALVDTQGHIPSSGLYYAKAENVLMKYDKNAEGTEADPKWKQINLTKAERETIASNIVALQGAVVTAQDTADDAYELAEEANENADTRVLKADFETFKESNTGVIDAVRETAEQGVADAAGALAAADAAAGAARTAKGAADDAQGRADAAYALAQTANSTANNAILKDGSVAMTKDLDVGTNKIINLKDPTSNTDAATKKYVDDKITTQNGNIGTLREQVVLRDGTATLTGNWNINKTGDQATNFKITGLPTPASASDAVNKSYVDDKFKMADAMQFKGVVNNANGLLNDKSNIEAGWTYKVGEAFSLASGENTVKVYVGDLLIANADASASVVYSKAEIGSTGATWSHVSSGYEAKNASYFSYEEIETGTGTNKTVTKTLYLDDIQDGRRGSVTFTDHGNIKSNISLTEGAPSVIGSNIASHIDVGFKLEWGTFPTTN